MTDPFSNFGDFNTDHLIISQANAALQDGQVDSAFSYLLKVIKESKDKENIALCHSKLAECYFRKERWRDSIESANASLHYPDSKVFLALSCFRRGDSHMAMSIFEQIENEASLSPRVKALMEADIVDIENDANNRNPSLPKHVEESVKDLKVQGNYKFKIHDFESALKLYRKALDVLDEWMQSVKDNKYFSSNDSFKNQYHRLYGILISNMINCSVKTDNLQECKSLCEKLIQIQPHWKKSLYWLAMYHLSIFQYTEARQAFIDCSNCANSENDKIDEKLNLVSFCERNDKKFKSASLSHWQSVYSSYCKNKSWLAGNFFAMSISKIYTDTSSHWHMTTSALIDNSGEITNFMAPKYEASEKDRNLINEMKRNQKKKFYIHVTQNRVDGTQKIGFTDTDQLSVISKDTLSLLEKDMSIIGVFNAFIKNYLKI